MRAIGFRLRAAAAIAACASVVAGGGALAASSAGTARPAEGRVVLSTIDDAGRPTTFPLYFARPQGHPRSVVVVFHGHGHNASEWARAGELRLIARRTGALAVAMHTRQTADSKGSFDSVDEEGRDAAAALSWVHRTVPSVRRTYLLCVSMGCTGAAYYLDSLARPVAGDADARFVQSRKPGRVTGLVISEGLSNLVETWAEAAAADPTSQGEIEQETGGTPLTDSAAYRSRSLALLPADRFDRVGFAAVVHDVDDGLVPVNQPAETRAALHAAGVPFAGVTVVRNDKACSTEHQTTGTGYVTTFTGIPVDDKVCLAGHATETVASTPMMRATFDAVAAMLKGRLQPGESTYNLP